MSPFESCSSDELRSAFVPFGGGGAAGPFTAGFTVPPITSPTVLTIVPFAARGWSQSRNAVEVGLRDRIGVAGVADLVEDERHPAAPGLLDFRHVALELRERDRRPAEPTTRIAYGSCGGIVSDGGGTNWFVVRAEL